MSDERRISPRGAILAAIVVALKAEFGADAAVLRRTGVEIPENALPTLLVRDGDEDSAGDATPKAAHQPQRLVARPVIEGVVRGSDPDALSVALTDLYEGVRRAIWGRSEVFDAAGPGSSAGIHLYQSPDPGDAARSDRFSLTLSITYIARY